MAKHYQNAMHDIRKKAKRTVFAEQPEKELARYLPVSILLYAVSTLLYAVVRTIGSMLLCMPASPRMGHCME